MITSTGLREGFSESCDGSGGVDDDDDDGDDRKIFDSFEDFRSVIPSS